MASSWQLRHTKLPICVVIALLSTVILLPDESALTYVLKALVCVGCAVALLLQSSASGQPRRSTWYLLAGVLCGALVAVLTLV